MPPGKNSATSAGPGNRATAWLVLASAFFLAELAVSAAPGLQEEPRPYIGYVYPAGGQQGTTFEVRVGGQDIDAVSGVLVTGQGVAAKLVENYRRLDFEEIRLLNEQLMALKRQSLSASARAMLMAAEKEIGISDRDTSSSAEPEAKEQPPASADTDANRTLMARIERRALEYVATPASPAIASLMIIEVAIAPDAAPGEREIRLVTLRGVSNPLRFVVGQLPETSKKPMTSATQQVLGKEAQALRKRVPGADEERVNLPCTVNGQIGSGEINRYRFEARKGQHLVITTLARQLVPFIADAVPGWFQPVLTLYGADGKELAYNDDYGFKADPVLLFEVPADGEYSFTIRDSLYRGREDFVYRITAGELPFITGIFPLGGRSGVPFKPELQGWNLQEAVLALQEPANTGFKGLHVTRNGLTSNRVPFSVDDLPEVQEQEPNDSPADAQKVTPPVIINGRVDRAGDRDVFQFRGRANEVIVAEVMARRLDSPLDSALTLTDDSGQVLAFNDDYEDLLAGLNTHHADSFLLARLPADGVFRLQISDTARQGGSAYGYRLRISPPQPDFELRVAPSSVNLGSKGQADLMVYARRKDGFEGTVNVGLKSPPADFSAVPVTLSRTQTVARLTISTTLNSTPAPIALFISGTSVITGRKVEHEAVAAEDRMQAFLWRQLVPAQDLLALVFDPAYEPPPKRVPAPLKPRERMSAAASPTNAVSGTNAVPERPRFTKEQVTARAKKLRLLFEEGMFTDDFYNSKLQELETAD